VVYGFADAEWTPFSWTLRRSLIHRTPSWSGTYCSAETGFSDQALKSTLGSLKQLSKRRRPRLSRSATSSEGLMGQPFKALPECSVWAVFIRPIGAPIAEHQSGTTMWSIVSIPRAALACGSGRLPSQPNHHGQIAVAANLSSVVMQLLTSEVIEQSLRSQCAGTGLGHSFRRLRPASRHRHRSFTMRRTEARPSPARGTAAKITTRP